MKTTTRVDYILRSEKVFVGLEDSKKTWNLCVRSGGVIVPFSLTICNQDCTIVLTSITEAEMNSTHALIFAIVFVFSGRSFGVSVSCR